MKQEEGDVALILLPGADRNTGAECKYDLTSVKIERKNTKSKENPEDIAFSS